VLLPTEPSATASPNPPSHVAILTGEADAWWSDTEEVPCALAAVRKRKAAMTADLESRVSRDSGSLPRESSAEAGWPHKAESLACAGLAR
jgi:hypothetical protein